MLLKHYFTPRLTHCGSCCYNCNTAHTHCTHRRTYGTLFEVLVSILLCISFTFLLAGNFVGLARVLHFCFPALGQTASVYVAAVLTASYTIGGGLLSVVYTDVVMSLTGIFGLMLCSIYVLYGKEKSELAPAPSTGFPGCVCSSSN
jgi:Na+/pantothenate symporter